MADVVKSIVILGGRGMLGSDLNAELTAKGYTCRVFDLPQFDITNPEHVADAVADSDLVINCAAYTNVEKAESEFQLAMNVNAVAAGQLGRIAKKKGVKVFHISTDFVFDGELDRPYIETDETNALSAYGKSKLEGEKLLQEANEDCCIVRVQWTYGDNGNNFVKKLISIAEQGKPLRVVDDQVGSPTATTLAAKLICKLVEKKPSGIFHLAASGYVSRFEMARFMFDKLGMDVDLTNCKTSDFPSAAKRPLNSRFDCEKLSELLGIEIESWQKSLERYLIGTK